MAEWLGIGLQNRVRRFESATDLNKILFLSIAKEGDFLFSARSSLAKQRDEDKKDQGAMKALRDFVAKVPTTADHASNPLMPLSIIIIFLSPVQARHLIKP